MVKKQISILVILTISSLCNGDILSNPTMEWPYIDHPGYGYTAEHWTPWGLGDFDSEIIDLSNYPCQKISHTGNGSDSYGPCGIYQTIDGLVPGQLYRVSNNMFSYGPLTLDPDISPYGTTGLSVNQIGVDPNAGIDPFDVPRWSLLLAEQIQDSQDTGFFFARWSQKDVYFRATGTTASVFTKHIGIVEEHVYENGPVNWQVDSYIDDFSLEAVVIGDQSTIEILGPVKADGYDLCEVILTVVDKENKALPGIQMKDIHIECSGTENDIIKHEYMQTDHLGRLIFWISSTTAEQKTIKVRIFDTPLEELQIKFNHPTGWKEYQVNFPAEHDYFEKCPAVLDGDRAIIGRADYELGSAEIYHFDGSEWTKEAVLRPSESSDMHFFGGSVDLEGKLAIVSNTIESHSPNSNSVFIYEFEGDKWNQKIKFTNPGTSSYADFGRTVALAGNLAFIGAPEENPGSCVYVYSNEDGKWGYHSTLKAPDDSSLNFGDSIEISDQWIVIGAKDAVFIYQRNEETWEYNSKLTFYSEENIQDICVDASSLYLSMSKGYDNVQIHEYSFDGSEWQLQNELTYINDYYYNNDTSISFRGNWGIANIPSAWSYYPFSDRAPVILHRDEENNWTTTATLHMPMFESRSDYGFADCAAMNDEWILITDRSGGCHFLKRYFQPADINQDDHVDPWDINIFAQWWLATDCENWQWCDRTDLDKSGSVDLVDFLQLSENWLCGL